MVNVTMSENNVINIGRIYPDIAVHCISIQSLALVNAAIEEDSLTGGSGNQMLASGHFPGSS